MHLYRLVSLSAITKQIRLFLSACFMDSNPNRGSMDAHRRFQNNIHRWFRSIGICAGHDILNREFVPTFHTIFSTLAVIATPCLLLSTIYFHNGTLALQASSVLGVAIKVHTNNCFSAHTIYDILENFQNDPFHFW